MVFISNLPIDFLLNHSQVESGDESANLVNIIFFVDFKFKSDPASSIEINSVEQAQPKFSLTSCANTKK